MLIDEIDKADPDVPNALLVPISSLEFTVTETGARVRRSRTALARQDDLGPELLMIITTNEERDLPDAFVRRCVVHELTMPERARLLEITRLHLAVRGLELTQPRLDLCRAIADKLDQFRAAAEGSGVRKPSTAEFLDAVIACVELEIGVDTPEWSWIERSVFRKTAEQT